MKDAETKFWEQTGLDIIQQVEEVIKPLIGTHKSGEIVKIGADGTPTTLIDVVAEKKVVTALEELERPLFLISEEIGEVKIGKGPPEAILVVDPLDGTSNAIKKIPAYGISLAMAPFPSSTPENPNLWVYEKTRLKRIRLRNRRVYERRLSRFYPMFRCRIRINGRLVSSHTQVLTQMYFKSTGSQKKFSDQRSVLPILQAYSAQTSQCKSLILRMLWTSFIVAAPGKTGSPLRATR